MQMELNLMSTLCAKLSIGASMSANNFRELLDVEWTINFNNHSIVRQVGPKLISIQNNFSERKLVPFTTERCCISMTKNVSPERVEI